VATRFCEARAKSILNRVPEQSQVPFRWTINPYRGCTHACTYCLWGETPVLLADGRHKPISDLEVGDAIYGTAFEGTARRFVPTTVLDKWLTVKAAYRVLLADGTEIIASGDHRLLSDQGWKHVRPADGGVAERPYLTTNNHLVGTGLFATQPLVNHDYKQGYLCGMLRGDIADLEPLRRAGEYLEELGVPTRQRVFQRAAGGSGEMTAIGTSSRSLVDRVRDVIEWPVLPSLDWCRGFLAGVFDAEGSRSEFALRIANADAQILS